MFRMIFDAEHIFEPGKPLIAPASLKYAVEFNQHLHVRSLGFDQGNFQVILVADSDQAGQCSILSFANVYHYYNEHLHLEVTEIIIDLSNTLSLEYSQRESKSLFQFSLRCGNHADPQLRIIGESLQIDGDFEFHLRVM